jgi:hypothetical protein
MIYDHALRAYRLQDSKIAFEYPKGTLSQEGLAAQLKVASEYRVSMGNGKVQADAERSGCTRAVFLCIHYRVLSDLAPDDARNRLTSPRAAFGDRDFEVVRYAEFRKARRAMENAKRKKSNQ